MMFLSVLIAAFLAVLAPAVPDAPRINGPRIYGERPGAEFLFKIPATGTRPMVFSAKGLPRGLSLDASTGIISGSVRREGEFNVTLIAENSEGRCERDLRIVIGDKICLTPPMGWNSWNCWGHEVSQEKVMNSAKALLEKGLDRYGWVYINIDDGWQGIRGGKYNAIQPNDKFPDMKALADFLHSNGLKLGIYSSPWVGTYAGHIGSGSDNADGSSDWIRDGLSDTHYRLDRTRMDRRMLMRFGEYSFVEADARQWAEWGVDYLKYDWYCNDLYSISEMRAALRKTGRDIVYSISNRAPFVLAPELPKLVECWRTTGDIEDNWPSVSKIGFESHSRWAPYCSPGSWPDADMLVIGNVGWGTPHPCRLTEDEQYSHFTLWAMLASPLLIGCDLEELDEFTLSLLCNPEVIDVNQDQLGYQASCVVRTDSTRIYAKPLEDGSVAIALFNLSGSRTSISFRPRDLGIIGTQTVRDLWRREDVSEVEDRQNWTAEVPPHGTVLVKLSPGTFTGKPYGVKGLLRQPFR